MARKPPVVKAPTRKKPSISGYMANVPKLEEPMKWGSPAWNQPKANPKNGTTVPGKPGNLDYDVNCTRVATAMELRARGFDVRAAAAGLDKTHLKNNLFTANNWRTTGGNVPKFTSVDLARPTVNGAFSSAPEGARFFVMGQWKPGGAHIWNGIKQNGKLVHVEGQSTKGVHPERYPDYIKEGSAKLMRTDTLKPHEDIKDWLEWDE